MSNLPKIPLDLRTAPETRALLDVYSTGDVDAILDAFEDQLGAVATGLQPAGGWDASQGRFPQNALKGSFYIVSIPGVVDGEAFAVGDWLIPLRARAPETSYAGNWLRADYGRIVPKGLPRRSFENMQALTSNIDLQYGDVSPGDAVMAGPYRFRVLDRNARDFDIANAAPEPVKLCFDASEGTFPEPYYRRDYVDDQAMQKAAYAFGGASIAYTDRSGGGVMTLQANKTYVLTRGVNIPYNLGIDMNGAIIVPGPDFSDRYLFRLNADDSGKQVRKIGGRRFRVIGGGSFENPHGVPATVFLGRGKHRFQDLEVEGYAGVFVKEGNSNADYTDLLQFSRINVNASIGSNWMFDIGYHGDGFVFESVHHGAGNQNQLRLNRCRGATLSSNINGNYRFEFCTAITMQGHHSEHGQISVLASDLIIDGAHLWRHTETQGETGGIIRAEAYDGQKKGNLSLRNIEFFYQQGRTHLPDRGIGTSADLVIDENAEVDVANCYRRGSTFRIPGGGYGSAMHVGQSRRNNGSVLWEAWEKSAGLHSKGSHISGGVVQPVHDSIPVPRSLTRSSASNMNGGWGRWKALGGPRFYRGLILAGPVDRMIGVPADTEFSFITQQDGAAVSTTWDNAPQPAASLITLRLYRGRSSRRYDEYVDLHPMGQPVMADQGYMLASGEYWEQRPRHSAGSWSPQGASDIDAANPATHVELNGENVHVRMPGTPVMSADGSKRLSSAGLPPAGVWRRGDRVIFPHSECEYDGYDWRRISQSGSLLSLHDENLAMDLSCAPVLFHDAPLNRDRTVSLTTGFPDGYEVTLIRSHEAGGTLYRLELDAPGRDAARAVLTQPGTWLRVSFDRRGKVWRITGRGGL